MDKIKFKDLDKDKFVIDYENALLEGLEEGNNKHDIQKEFGSIYGIVGRTVRDWLSKISVDGKLNETKSYYDMDFDEVFDYYSDNVKTVQHIPSTNADIKIKHKRILVVVMSDIHFGTKYIDIDRLKEDVKVISNNEKVFALFGGDILDWVPGGPPDLASEQIMGDPNFARYMAKVTVQKLSGSMLAMVSGCHDNWDKTQPYILDLEKYTLTGIVAPDELMLHVTLDGWEQDIFLRHKMRHHSAYNRCHSVYRTWKDIKFDLGIECHLHTPSIGVQYEQQMPVYAICGSSYKRRDGFPRRIGFYSKPISIPGFIMDSESKTFIPLFDWREGLKLL